ncbi:MAG: response regulator [bacterium]|nr:response regulator [bacterium]
MSANKYWPIFVLIWALFSFFFSPSASLAQKYHTRTFFEEDGLTSNTVFNAAQDSLGNLWFGTRNGISIFNGISWQDIRSIEPEAPKGAGNVLIDDSGSVWWVSRIQPSSVSNLVDGTWKPLPQIPFKTRNSGVTNALSWAPEVGPTHLVLTFGKNQLVMWNGEQWSTLKSVFPFGDVISFSRLNSILYVSTNEGLFCIDLTNPNHPFIPDLNLPPGLVAATAHDSQTGVSWVVGEQWAVRLKDEKFDCLFDLPEMKMARREHGTSACVGPHGDLYFSGYLQIFHFLPEFGLELLSKNSGLSCDGGYHVMRDRENSIWISGFRGTTQILSHKLVGFSSDHGLLGDEVSAIQKLPNGQMLLGHRYGLTLMGSEMETIPFGKTPDLKSRVIDLALGRNNQIWIAADERGLGRMDSDNNIQWYHEDQGILGSVYAVLDHPEHGVLVGTNLGLFKKSGPQFDYVNIHKDPKAQGNLIRRLFSLKDGSLAISTGFSGIFIWDNDNLVHAPGIPNGLSASAYTVFETRTGELWAGTSGGLFRVTPNGLEPVSQPGLIIERPIYSITQDNLNRIWFGTDSGVCIWDQNKLIWLDPTTGLLGTETNRDALVLDDDGKMWIGTDSGLSIYRHEFNDLPIIPPVLCISEISINGNIHPLNSELEINAPLPTMILNCRAAYFQNKNRLTFHAKAVGSSVSNLPLHLTWPGTLILTNIPPGDFQIEIQAQTPDGQVTNTVTTPVISVSRPLPERWYIKVLMALVWLALVWFVIAYLLGQRYSRRLEKEVSRQLAGLQKSEENSRRESERLKGTLASISDGVVVIDGTGKIVIFNRAAEILFADKVIPYVGCSLQSLLPVEALIENKHAEIYKNVLTHPESIREFSEEVPIRISPTQTNWFEISGVSLSSTLGGMVFAFRNITNRRNREKEKLRGQKLESLGLLAGGIAHDFNNLLTIMMGNLSLIKSANLPTPAQISQVEKTIQATQRARGLTHQLLTFAKGGEPVQAPSDLSPIIRDATSFCLSGSSVDFSFEIPENLNFSSIDANQIYQVISNLVINANQSMPQGGKIQITACNTKISDRNMVQIDIQDEGCGISDKEQALVFDPYFSTRKKGTGLGLAIANSIAINHGGFLLVQSELGIGSTFSLLLPACDSGTKIIPENQNPETPEKLPNNLKVLLMDDELEIRIILEKMLNDLGHKTSGAARGEDAIQSYRQAIENDDAFDLVFLDLTIPGGMGGLETLSFLRKLNPKVRAIVSSGYSEDPAMGHYKKLGFAGILEKPFNYDDLQVCLESLDDSGWE